MLLKTGDVLQNRYRVVKLLAQGGFGTLYRTWDISLGRPCVLKENLAPSPDAQRQFLREAKILANLSHPHLPRVTDYFLIQGQGQYLVMDYVEGQDLQQILEDRSGPLPEDRVVVWASQICDALEYLHHQNPPVIHRDIKPANIRITPGGQAMLVDFGIAKVYDPKTKTTEGAQAVSPGYSPHEQYGKGKTDARTDVYALGATLYTLLTGQEPVESIQRVINDPLVQPRQLNPHISIRISAALMRAMQLDAAQRFQSATEFKKSMLPPPPVQVSTPAPVLMQSPVLPYPAASARPSLPWGWISLVGLLSLVILILLFLIAGRPTNKSTLTGDQSTFIPSIADPKPTTTFGGVAVNPVLTPISESPQEPTLTPIAYFVQSGDTCSEIAEAFGVSVEDIVSQNEGLSPDCGILYAGQALFIPQIDGPLSTPAAIRSPASVEPVVTRVSNIDGMPMVSIPAGKFMMGADESDLEAGEVEQPQHEVYLSAYWIDLTEVTNQMYARCVDEGVCQPPASRSSKTRDLYFSEPAFLNYPVIHVSWDEAEVYCSWAERRLPTEAEWEKAARSTDGRIFPWGNSPASARKANFGELVGDTKSVGSFPDGVSPYGVFDMAGNVAEWVSDRYGSDYYSISPFRDPQGSKLGDFRLIRGGSWFNPARGLRTTSRLWNYPDLRSDTIGFRCAK